MSLKETLFLFKSDPLMVILRCPICRQSLRVALASDKKLSIRCPTCRHEFIFDCGKNRRKAKIVAALPLILVFVNIGLPLVLISRAIVLSKIIRKQYEDTAIKMRSTFENEMSKLKAKYAEEIRAINPQQLKVSAGKHYAIIWEERKRYSEKYAITPREKAQLEMLALSKDGTKTIKAIIGEIAAKAAPKNSTINIFSSQNGYRLDIDFDMSELSTGEKGTKTKHHTVDSLRKDVTRLISKVTNDVYEFCHDLELESISIGCRHHVQMMDSEDNQTNDVSNAILYKIRLDKRNLQVLEDNPFLNTYSTTQYFKVVEDDFPNLRIMQKG